jgi:hypothetical protein
MKLQQPWPEGYSVNARSPYGFRKHPITGRRTFHHGVDVAGVFLVTSAADGVVRHVGADWHSLSPAGKKRQSGGNTVGIEHGAGLWTFYYHGKHQTKLRVGERVKAGEFIFTSGTTGGSTGNHLHFETRRSRRWGDTMDPVPLLQNGTPQLILPVTGKPSKQTWAVWQEDLKAKWGYAGRIDGIPGPMTNMAIQRYAGVKVDGILGPITRRAVQAKIKVIPDGIWGRNTWSEIQRRLNSGSM